MKPVNENQGPWFQTYTGKKFDLLKPRAEDICIEDIAHGLALQCRFNGAVKEFYSVAQHCVHVSQLLPEDRGLLGLLHDAAEAYIGDIVMPLRACLVADGQYDSDRLQAIEASIMIQVAEKFGLGDWRKFHDIDVHKADLQMLVTEARDLLGGQTIPWGINAKPIDMTVESWDAPFAEKAFMLAFEMLGGKVREMCDLSKVKTLGAYQEVEKTHSDLFDK